MHEQEELELRAAIAGLAPNKYRRRFDDNLRRRVARFARSRLRQGATTKDVATALDVGAPTILRCLEAVPELVPIAVVDDEVVGEVQPAPAQFAVVPPVQPSRAPPQVRPGLTVHGPRGLRVDGLTVDDVAVLFERMSACSA